MIPAVLSTESGVLCIMNPTYFILKILMSIYIGCFYFVTYSTDQPCRQFIRPMLREPEMQKSTQVTIYTTKI